MYNISTHSAPESHGAGKRCRLTGEATVPPLGQKVIAHVRTITIKHTAIFHYNLLYSSTTCLLNKEM